MPNRVRRDRGRVALVALETPGPAAPGVVRLGGRLGYAGLEIVLPLECPRHAVVRVRPQRRRERGPEAPSDQEQHVRVAGRIEVETDDPGESEGVGSYLPAWAWSP